MHTNFFVATDGLKAPELPEVIILIKEQPRVQNR